MKKITIITASGVKNLDLALQFEQKLHSMGVDVTLINLMKVELPLYTSESDAKYNANDLLGQWAGVLKESTGYIFLAPEYNGGIPPLFSNFMAWVSRSSKDWRECFNGKAAVIGTHSGGGGSNVLMALRMQLSYIGMNVLGRQILTHSAKPLDPQSLEAVCVQLVKLS